MYELEEKLTKDYILKYVSQEEIYSHFLHIEVQTHSYFRSPLRVDKNPSCNFSWFRGTLQYRDWTESKPKDCFNIVQELYGCSFFEALQIIKRELIVGKERTPRPRIELKREQSKSKPKARVQVKVSRWQKEVVDYLNSYSITLEQCKHFNVFPIDKVWLNGRLFWTYSRKDPALGYYFGKAENGEQRWKIYFFNRTKNDGMRFLCNTNRINGWKQLPKTGKNLIITKSAKDVICLDRLGYPSIAMQNEATIPYDYIIEELKSRFTYIYSLYDFDRTGVINANKLKRLYNIPYLFLTNGRFGTKDYGQKDISDYIKANNIHQAKQLLSQYV